MRSADSSSPRNWVITGGTKGIGLATAKLATSQGDRVAVLARDPTAINPDWVEMALTCDVSQESSVAEAFEQIEAEWNSVHVLVNNAGKHIGSRLDGLTAADWSEIHSVNLDGPFHVIRESVPLMQEGGSIVNVGAVVGFRGFPGDAAYGASKAGLAGLTNVLAIELAKQGIRVNLVLPGFVSTEMTSSISDAARKLIIDRIPLGREGKDQEIAEVINWVARSTYMTGSVVATDGGLMCQL